MASVMNKFKVILWKSYVLRRRHWLLSSFEVLAPLLLFYIFTRYCPKEIKAEQDYVIYPPHRLKDLVDQFNMGQGEFHQIGFAPFTPATDEIASDLEEKLSETNLRGKFNITKFTSEAQLNKWLNSRNDPFELMNIVGIVCDVGPIKLKYKIKNYKEIASSVDELFGYPFESGKYFLNMFLIIQMIIDTNFIRRLTGEKHEIALQKFPDLGFEILSVANYVFPIVTTCSFVFIMPAILTKIVEEKLTGIKELQKMTGLHTWMLWTGWMIHSLMVYSISVIIITVMFRLPWLDRCELLNHRFSDNICEPLYQVDSWLVIWYLLMLFIVTMVLYCFAVSTFFTSPNLATIVGILLWIIPPFTMLDMLTSTSPASKSAQLISCISPPVCLSWAFTIFINFQHKGKFWSWSRFFEKGTTGGLSLAHVIFMFYFDWFLFSIITWYVDAVKPGPYGRAKPFYFPLKLWKSNKDNVGSCEIDDQNNFEPPPKDTKIGISIQSLRKVFGPKVAVDKVNLDIYEGEITALLGHNGAGKTTTMSILCGLYSPSKGSVIVDGVNIFDDMDRFRHNLGLCPQHNLLFSYLTVLEHLVFFGMLKGLPKDRAEAVGMKLLVSFHITNKSNQYVAQLSGGMKRKLCLAIALMGDPKILMLDEPTAGMDPESRREVWDILLNYRGARTILITTHFMEEADVLGDRIAIMDHGRVSCYGTSIFLKKLYGTGYHIVILKEAEKLEVPITTVMEDHLNDPKLKTNLPTQLSYNVSSNDAAKFPSLFEVLENRKTELGITGISIACTTMEDVFLRVAEGGLPFEVKAIPAELILSSLPVVQTRIRLEGFMLAIHQLRALFVKKMIFLYRTWFGTLIFALTPLLAIILILSGGLLSEIEHIDDSIEMNLAMYDNTEVPYTFSHHQVVKDSFNDIVIAQGSSPEEFDVNINEGLKTRVQEDKSYYHRTVVAVEFNRSVISALHNGLAVHAAPVALNLITNSILKSYSPTSSVTVISHPFHGIKENLCDNHELMSEAVAVVKALPWVLLVCGLMIIVARFISLPLIERANGAKPLQLMTGVSPFIYWLSHFLWDFIIYFTATSLMIGAIWLLDVDKTITMSGKMHLLFFLILLYGISGAPFAYLVTFLTKSSAKAISLFLMFNLATGVIAPLVMLAVGKDYQYRKQTPSLTFDLINNLLCLNPLYALCAAMLCLVKTMLVESSCKRCSDYCDSEDIFEEQSENFFSILQYVVFLSVEWFFYWLLIFLIEFGPLMKLFSMIKNLWIGPMFKFTVIDDDDVVEEKQKAKSFLHGNSQSVPVLRVCGLGKKYNRNIAAVHEVSFLVEKGQCFGLLGVNGAGKTTTFKMLTGEETPTSGTASVLNFDLIRQKTQFLAEIGYCPQFDAIIEDLTGEEMLQLYAALRGTPSDDIKSKVETWVRFMGIDEYARAPCGTYSGGNKRKLSTAMALIGDPAVVFLDEPTAGVDPVSRRRLWDVLARCQKTGQAIVLTSHSMEECEALCSRLTILVGGHMKCIGSTQYLKQRYGQGYTIMIKLFTNNPDADDALFAFKNAVNRTFSRCFIKDEHKGLLHYHIADNSMLLSVLFSKLEDLRSQHSIVEDYTVGDTTLEQVFMSFAKQVPPTIVIEPVDV
ncbi:phospholipid-transporting ATPase ABCA1-like [Macrosteles quadrilineatus]|uniref:phospholipid-transporting ATPase ABCA1-like n=1 Tax=Macrosteles quadrilineatus TaxID=74068 RepID=UPI0023E314DF|nr:phospholipid-transporting ATPase ABCA1-like [Macrosteles quadrilineatus]